MRDRFHKGMYRIADGDKTDLSYKKKQLECALEVPVTLQQCIVGWITTR